MVEKQKQNKVSFSQWANFGIPQYEALGNILSKVPGLVLVCALFGDKGT